MLFIVIIQIRKNNTPTFIFKYIIIYNIAKLNLFIFASPPLELNKRQNMTLIITCLVSITIQ